MSKHPKQAFGISEDGQELRVVHLVRDRMEVYLQNLDRIDMDRSLYHFVEEPPPAPEKEKNAWEDNGSDNGEITLDEFDSGFTTEFKLTPWESMLNSYDLKHGVLAINVNDESLIKSYEHLPTRRAIKQFARANIDPIEFKAKNWHASTVSFNHRLQTWIQHGTNLLLSLLDDYGKKYKLPLFYQLADANDIALTDYFRIHALDGETRTLLVYLGQDYRKAFLFEKGVWTNTLLLQISHANPEPDIVYSKLALALDSAQLSDPDQIVICGDLASQELLDYLAKQYSHDTVNVLRFPKIIINNERAEVFDAYYFAQFALPIALAYKALHPDDGRWTRSNFLPHKTLEGQKTFRVAWHGLLILIAVFGVTLGGTVSTLRTNQIYRRAKDTKRDQDFKIARLRVEAAEIQKIRADLELQQKNIEIMRTILDGKNPWSHLLEILNRRFAGRGISWLTNLRQENGRLSITGNITNRDHILSFAEILPGSEIAKVTQTKIKDRTVWAFEIKSDLPPVDWIKIIEEDLEELVAFKKRYGEGQGDAQSSGPAVPGAPGAVAQARAVHVKSVDAYKGLSPIGEKYIPIPNADQIKKAGDSLKDYNAFIAAINRGNMWEYRDLGVKFINNFGGNPLVPFVRWHMAYRMFLDKELSLVRIYTEPLMKNPNDQLYPYALLVSARTDFVQGLGQYLNKYNKLKNDYARHPLIGQIKEDLAVVEKGVKK